MAKRTSPAFELWKVEPSYTLLIQTHIPANDQTIRRLRFLELFIVIGFNLDQGTKDILVVISIFISALTSDACLHMEL